MSELARAEIASATLVANPGCYPTSIVIPLVPLLKSGLIRADGIVACSMSGVSGAGRKGSIELSFSEVNENAKAYRVTSHQHTPEIAGALSSFSGAHASISFVPHLIPITRGIHSTIHATLVDGTTMDDIDGALNEHYCAEPFVRLTGGISPEISHVVGTNTVAIGTQVNADTNQVVIPSTLDNLIKGAAGQAVQNMNIMAGYAETEGLN
jgi:N-acetyl-gamma-glutamyl-phosphate reductase